MMSTETGPGAQAGGKGKIRLQGNTCPRCGGEATEDGWCPTCERRITPPPVILFERRSTGRGPRRWKVRRRYLHLTAALMSLLIPGAGQIYKGRIKTGIAWFVVVVAAYLYVGLPALLIHLMCVVTAGSAARVLHRPFIANGSGWTKR